MSDFEIAKKLISLYKPYKWYLILSLPCAFVVSLVPGSSAILVKPLIDNVFIQKDKWYMWFVPVCVVLLYMLKAIARFLHAYLLSIAGQKAVRDLRKNMFEHLQSLSIDFFDSSDSGSLISRFTYDISLVQMMAPNILYLFKEPLTLLWLTIILFYIDLKLTLLSLIFLPFAGIGVWHFSKKVREVTGQSQERMGELTKSLQESISGVRIVKAFNAEEKELLKFSESNEGFFEAVRRAVKYTESLSPAVEFVGALGLGLVIYYGAYRVIVEKEISPGSFFTFLTAVGMMYEPYRQLSKINALIQTCLSAGKRIFEILSLKPRIVEKEDAVDLKEFRDSIVFDGVWFRYSNDYIIKNFSLTIKKGEIIGIAGEVGAGKSTLSQLLVRFYDVEKGRILIDGRDIRDLRIKSLRNKIALITQDVFLFNDTIMENIRYGNWDANEKDVENAARLAGLHDFIISLPDGYFTRVGERGCNLSGGQRQKISIARAFLKNAPILILDEATSNLDAESEREIESAIYDLMTGKTVIIISHRPSFLQKADRIIVMHKGEKVKEGRFDEIFSKNVIDYALKKMEKGN